MAMLTYWTGGTAAAPTHTIDADYCTVDYTDNTVGCVFYLWTRIATGTWKPMITLMDQFGNWATYTETSFTTASNPATFSIVDNRQDMQVPTLATASVSPVALTLGATTDYSTAVITTVVVTVDDHEDGTNADPNASGIASVWVYVTDTDAVEWVFNVPSSITSDDASGSAMVYRVIFSFPSYAPVGIYTVERIEAVDYAGNVGTAFLDTAVTVSWSASNTDDVTSCQTLTLLDASLTASADVDATASVLLTCTEKYTGDNYAYVSYQSPSYLAAGDSVKSTMVVSDDGYYGLQGITATSYTTSFGEPGFWLTAGVGTFDFAVAQGNAGSTLGSWTLYEVITVTDSGAAQRYTSDLGAASSVVPSVFAVAIAALFALLRL